MKLSTVIGFLAGCWAQIPESQIGAKLAVPPGAFKIIKIRKTILVHKRILGIYLFFRLTIINI